MAGGVIKVVKKRLDWGGSEAVGWRWMGTHKRMRFRGRLPQGRVLTFCDLGFWLILKMLGKFGRTLLKVAEK